MMMRLSMRALLFVMLLALLVGCGQATSSPSLTPVFAFTEAVVGPNRLPIGIIQDGSPVNDATAQVTLRFFDLAQDPNGANPLGSAIATYYGAGLPAAVYVASFDFPNAGNWGVEVQVLRAGMTEPSVSRLQLTVSDRAIAPKVGDAAIVADTLTPLSVADTNQLVSSNEVNIALYQVNLRDALAANRPVALLFATPGFCRTAVCGPSLQVFSQLQQQFGADVAFIHSEIYRFPFSDSFAQQNDIFQQAMREGRALTDAERKVGVSDAYYAWGLQSEPWLFLIDRNGVIVKRYEGGLTSEELTPDIQALLP
jgi:hypothetical protein